MSAPRNDFARGQAGEIGKAQTTQIELCFTAPRQVKTSFPSLKFLPGRVLAILLSGRRFTHKDSWLELGHARLADSIWKLRRLGWTVQMDEETLATSDAGRPATIGIYFLKPETIADAGERGREFVAECARIEQERRAA
jgi:hypothetical protein